MALGCCPKKSVAENPPLAALERNRQGQFVLVGCGGRRRRSSLCTPPLPTRRQSSTTPASPPPSRICTEDRPRTYTTLNLLQSETVRLLASGAGLEISDAPPTSCLRWRLLLSPRSVFSPLHLVAGGLHQRWMRCSPWRQTKSAKCGRKQVPTIVFWMKRGNAAMCGLQA